MDTLFVTNYLSHVLITEKVLPMLNRSKMEKPRVVQVSSTYVHLRLKRVTAAPLSSSPYN
jgi:hypothetical protein